MTVLAWKYKLYLIIFPSLFFIFKLNRKKKSEKSKQSKMRWPWLLTTKAKALCFSHHQRQLLDWCTCRSKVTRADGWHGTSHRVSTQVSVELQDVSKASAFVKELNGKRAADGNCPSASCSPPWECGEHGSLKTPFEPESPFHRHASSWWGTFVRNCFTPWRLKE